MKEKVKEEIVRALGQTKRKDQNSVLKIKRRISKKHRSSFPSNMELLSTYKGMLGKGLLKKSGAIEQLLVKSPIRSLSGIVNISILTKPHPCPGQCIFCPTEKGFPKSYVAGEPAADRAKALDFDPFLQITKRIEALQAQGHPTDKIELRIVGGTWNAYPKRYQTWFIKRCFQAANACPAETRWSKRRRACLSASFRGEGLERLQNENETAENRIVGMSVETRPDFITKKEIARLRDLGVTLVELGVQTIFNDIHKICKTGINAESITAATHLLKDAGFKVLYQIMPNLPRSSQKKDTQMFKTIFRDARFKPDWIKIYPCVVCANTGLHNMWERGGYTPYTKKELIGLLSEIKKMTPFWVRVARVFRDIPANKIKAGCKTSNIREIVQKNLKDQGWQCNCIRCREIRDQYIPNEEIALFREDYSASKGKEIFLSFENKSRTKLFSVLRLRRPSQIVLPVLEGTAIIRELQTFGLQVPISENKKAPQHKGLGSRLIKEAGRIAKEEWGLKKIAVISGIGAREYYRRKHGYKLRATYMIKGLNK